MVDKLLDRESLLLRLNKAQWDEIFTSNISHPPDFFYRIFDSKCNISRKKTRCIEDFLK